MSGARRPLVVANWKMHLDEAHARALVGGIAAGRTGLEEADLGVAPPFPFLPATLAAAAGTSIDVGAQDVYWEAQGAFTGEVSAPMLAGLGARFAIVGHSERRSWFRESDDDVRKKAAACLRHGLYPIVCVGETEDERLAGETLPVVERQLRTGLADVGSASGALVVVAYEPVWAIGTGRVPTADQIEEVHRMIREQLSSALGPAGGGAVRILYGGSVNPKNAAEILSLPEVDGALVGGASLEAEKFLAIARALPRRA